MNIQIYNEQFIRDVMANVQRVELIKGPAAVLYGRGSFGATINRLTRRPQFLKTTEVAGTIGTKEGTDTAIKEFFIGGALAWLFPFTHSPDFHRNYRWTGAYIFPAKYIPTGDKN